MSSYSAVAAPPFYWKVPVPEKDYKYENYRRIRQISNQTQQKRNEPLRAAFIPGVTKNSKYSHVTSRVGETLRVQARKADEAAKSRSQSSTSMKALPSRYQQNGKSSQPPVQTVTVTGAGGRRLSRSFADLSVDHFGTDSTKRKGTSISANGQSQTYNRRKNPTLQPEEESVYNWRFSDTPPQPHGDVPISKSQQEKPQMCHRVEYLPCDGICADETVVDDKGTDSARSTASSRTSRGCNTEETRIIQHQKAAPGFYRQRSASFDQNIDSNDVPHVDHVDEDEPDYSDLRNPKARGAHTIASSNSNAHRTSDGVKRTSKQQFVRSNSVMASKPHNNNTNESVSSSKSALSHSRANGGSVASILKGSSQAQGDFPHNLGTVPKYLKQRQEEWKIEQEAKQVAERNAHIPPGHVLMSEPERLETMSMLRKNYDGLILDLNRIPIRIDTIRVRDHKIDLERQLSKLEEAMKIFSRPRVFVKMDK